MASRAIREVQALNIVTQELSDDIGVEKLNYASIESLEDLDKIEAEQPWVLNQVNFSLMFSNQSLYIDNFPLNNLVLYFHLYFRNLFVKVIN